MSASGRFVIFPPSVTHAGGTLDITYHHRQLLQPGQKITRVDVSGAVDAGANLLSQAEPIVMVGSRSLAALLGVINPTVGLKLTGGGVLRFQQADDDNGVFMTGLTDHVTETFGLGYLTVESITAKQGDENGAEAALRLNVLSADGITDPITTSVLASFAAAPAPAFGTEFYLGPTYYNSAAIPGILSATVEFGVMLAPFFSSGAVFPTGVRIIRRRPKLSVECAKVSADAAASVFVRALAGPFVQYFEKAVDAGTRVSRASGAHIKFSASAGAWFREEQGGQGLDDATVKYCCYPTTNITYSAVSTIP